MRWQKLQAASAVIHGSRRGGNEYKGPGETLLRSWGKDRAAETV